MRRPLLLTVIDVVPAFVNIIWIIHDEGTSKAITVLGRYMGVIPEGSRLYT